MPRYCKKSDEDGTNQEFFKALWARYKAGETELGVTLSLAEQHFFARKLDSDEVNDVLNRMDDADDSRIFGGMVTAEEMAASGFRIKLQKIQCVCLKCGEAVPTYVTKENELACGGVEASHKSAKRSKRNTGLYANLVKPRREDGKLGDPEKLVTTQEKQIFKTWTPLKKLASEVS